MMMLVLSEVGEAVEANRKMKRANLVMFQREVSNPQESDHATKHWQFCFEQFVKDTLEDELADVAIRLFDLCGAMNLGISELSDDEINDLRKDFVSSFGSRSFCERCFFLCAILCDSDNKLESLVDVIGAALVYLFFVCEDMGIDLVRFIELKMRYNVLRPVLHGKQY